MAVFILPIQFLQYGSRKSVCDKPQLTFAKVNFYHFFAFEKVNFMYLCKKFKIWNILKYNL